MSEVSREEFEAVLERLEKLEKWREVVQCPHCEGMGEMGGYKLFECPTCYGMGVRQRGRICT